MRDIQNRSDLETLMQNFYDRLLNDNSISYIFTDIAKIDLAHHLPILTDFWEQILFNSGKYNNNPLKIHQELNRKTKLSDAHFATWLHHFTQTVDELFAGENAEKIKTRALSIATVMKIKLAESFLS